MNIHPLKLSFYAPVLAVMLTGQVLAASPQCPMTYEIFELAVPHIDMETCPQSADNDSAFCRASVGSDQVHVFYFDTQADQCLLKVVSYEDDAFTLELDVP